MIEVEVRLGAALRERLDGFRPQLTLQFRGSVNFVGSGDES